MDAERTPMRRRRGACDGVARGAGPGLNRRERGSRDGSSLSGRTATRALVAVGAYVAQDLRDAEGLTRPLLRRAALRLVTSRAEPVRRIGGAYLRLDPPTPQEMPPRREAVIEVRPSAPPQRTLPSGPDAAADDERPPC
jgi:hypothetical protein